MSGPATYDSVSRINHWAIAVAAIIVLGIGLYLGNFEGNKEFNTTLRNFHKATGVLILIYATWRVLWRMVQGFPAAVSTVPAWQIAAARLLHWILMIAVIVMPLSGLLRTLFAGYPVSMYGLFTIPAPDKIVWLKDLAGEIHEIGGWILLVAVLLHLAAAIKHHFIARDATLVRILTGRATR